MKRFLLTAALFSIPIVAAFVFPFAFFALTREFETPSQVLAVQQNSNGAIYRSAFYDYDRPYKTLGAIESDPQVLVLGTSRVLQLHASLFKDPSDFYNAGRAISKPSELPVFINALPSNSKVQVIVLAVDQNFLSSAFSSPAEPIVQPTHLSIFEFFLAQGWKTAWQYYFQGRFSLSGLIQLNKTSQNIGLTALVEGDGFQKDGSDEESNIAAQKSQRSSQIQGALDLITPQGSGYFFDSSLSQQGLSYIEQFLELCRARNIKVIGFLPPYATEVYQKIDSLHSSYADTMQEEPVALKTLFNQYNDSFYDLSNLSTFGSSDNEMIDSAHLDEQGSARELQYLANHEAALKPYVDMTAIKSILSQTSSI